MKAPISLAAQERPCAFSFKVACARVRAAWFSDAKLAQRGGGEKSKRMESQVAQRPWEYRRVGDRLDEVGTDDTCACLDYSETIVIYNI